jgi:hypothetical protein
MLRLELSSESEPDEELATEEPASDSSHEARDEVSTASRSSSEDEDVSVRDFLVNVSVARRGTWGAGVPVALGRVGRTAWEIRRRKDDMAGAGVVDLCRRVLTTEPGGSYVDACLLGRVLDAAGRVVIE